MLHRWIAPLTCVLWLSLCVDRAVLAQTPPSDEARDAIKGGQALDGAGDRDTSENRGVPISRFLRPDGTLSFPPEGIEGSLDITGFRLIEGPDSEPRFVPEGVERGSVPSGACGFTSPTDSACATP